MNNQIARYFSPDESLSLILEDDGNTGYAYLLNNTGEITADCWLYNRHKAPTDVQWTSPENMPFANAADYVKPEFHHGHLSLHSDNVTVDWLKEGAELLVCGKLFARLVVGSKPGWSVLAAKDGPLALVLSDGRT